MNCHPQMRTLNSLTKPKQRSRCNVLRVRIVIETNQTSESKQSDHKEKIKSNHQNQESCGDELNFALIMKDNIDVAMAISDYQQSKIHSIDEAMKIKLQQQSVVQLEQEIVKLQKMAEDERIRQEQIYQQQIYQQQLLLQQQRQREYEVQQKILAEELARQKALAQKQALAEAQKYQEALRIQELNRQEQIRQQELIRIQREQAEAERIRKEKELYDNAQKLKAQEEALKEEKRKQQEILIKKQQEYEAQQAKDKAQKEKNLRTLQYNKIWIVQNNVQYNEPYQFKIHVNFTYISINTYVSFVSWKSCEFQIIYQSTNMSS